jgi:hypothetical protein
MLMGFSFLVEWETLGFTFLKTFTGTPESNIWALSSAPNMSPITSSRKGLDRHKFPALHRINWLLASFESFHQ